MRAVTRPRQAFAVAAIAGLAVLGLPALAASAARAPAPSSALASKPGIDHFNVSQTHSPQLLKALAGPPSPTALAHPLTAAGSVLAAPAVVANAAIPGAAQGIDVASGQHMGGAISWSQVAGAGYEFAGIKATEGNYYTNPYYASDQPAASGAGLSVIGYSFANPYAGNGTAAQQAQYLVSNATVGGKVPPLMLDIEYNPYISQETNGKR
jgi:Glycosyl hydrolases family 25